MGSRVQHPRSPRQPDPGLGVTGAPRASWASHQRCVLASRMAAQAIKSKAPEAKRARRDKQVLSAPLLPTSGICLGLGLANPGIARALKGPRGPSGLTEVLPT